MRTVAEDDGLKKGGSRTRAEDRSEKTGELFAKLRKKQ